MKLIKTLAAVLAMLLIPVLASAQTTQKNNKKNLVIKEWNTSAKTNRFKLKIKKIEKVIHEKIEVHAYHEFYPGG